MSSKMEKIFSISEIEIKSKIKKARWLIFLLTLVMLIIETLLMFFLTRETKVLFLVVGIVLFLIYSVFLVYLWLFKLPILKAYKLEVSRSNTKLTTATGKIIKIDDKVFCKNSLKYTKVIFVIDNNEIELEILNSEISNFQVNKSYSIAYKGSNLYKYEERN